MVEGATSNLVKVAEASEDDCRRVALGRVRSASVGVHVVAGLARSVHGRRSCRLGE